MTFTFICRKCAKKSPTSACAYQIHHSTAFPNYIKDNLGCLCGHKPEWEEYKGTDLFIPLNLKCSSESALERKDEK
jgi:hypothetical protein